MVQREWFEVALSSIGDGVITTDMAGKVSFLNPVAETMTGWKRWALKPVDPFFSKQGVGTLLRIQVVGSAKAPKFGRDRGPKEKS